MIPNLHRMILMIIASSESNATGHDQLTTKKNLRDLLSEDVSTSSDCSTAYLRNTSNDDYFNNKEAIMSQNDEYFGGFTDPSNDESNMVTNRVEKVSPKEDDFQRLETKGNLTDINLGTF